MRALVAAALIALVAMSCDSIGGRATPVPAPTPPRITRSVALQMIGGDPPQLLSAAPDAGAFLLPYRGGWRYDGRTGTLITAPTTPEPLEHPAPAGTLTAIEQQSQTPGRRYSISRELAIRERTSGAERVIYRSPEMFYWSGWSPDGKFIALWEVDSFSGSIDQDGRPLLVIDAISGEKVDLGRTLLFGTTAWTPPHTLAFVSGSFRMLWDDKRVRLWSPENGVRDVTQPGTAGFAPAWSADGGSLYFASGPNGQYEPSSVFAGLGVGDRRITVVDVATGRLRTLAHETGYIEEGARPSRDGKRLLVLRRKTVSAADLQSIADVPFEFWLTDLNGAHGTALVRIPKAFGAYGWLPDPNQWEWTE
jgi:hypothetical protein